MRESELARLSHARESELLVILASELEDRRLQDILQPLARGRQPSVIFSILKALQGHYKLEAWDYTIGISACAPMWQLALSLFSAMPGARVQRNVIHFNAMSSCNRWRPALSLFQTMLLSDLEPDAISFNTAISSQEQWQLAFRFLAMPGIRPNMVTLNALISSCDGEWWLALMALSGLDPNRTAEPITFNAAMSSCQKAGHWPWATEVLRTMSRLQSERDIISYSSVVSACEKAAAWAEALSIGRVLQESQLQLDLIFNASLSACEKSGNWQLSLHLLRSEVRPDVISFNATISSYDRIGRWQHAIETMCAFHPDVISFNAAIGSCGNGGAWEHALDVFFAMPGSRLSMDVVTLSAAITACERAGLWREALRLVEVALDIGVEPDVICCNTLINCFEQAGHWEQALSVFASMRRPDTMSFNSAISSCEKKGRWQQALALFQAIFAANLEATRISFNATMSACKVAGQWQHCLLLFAAMIRGSVGPGVDSFNVAMESLQQAMVFRQDAAWMGGVQRMVTGLKSELMESLKTDRMLYNCMAASQVSFNSLRSGREFKALVQPKWQTRKR